MDFEQPQSIAAAADALRPQGPWHLIVVATGMLSGPTGGPEKRLTDLNATHLAASLPPTPSARPWITDCP